MFSRFKPPASHSAGTAAPVRDELSVLLRLAAPVVISRIGIMTMGLSDALVVGRYSPVQLGFHALGWAPTAAVLTAAVGLLTGVPVMTSQVIGAGRRDLAGAVLRRGVVYAFQLSVLAAGALWLLGPIFLHGIGLQPYLAEGASRVLAVFCLSLPISIVSVAMSLWLEAMSKPAPAMTMMWLANGVNLAIDLVLVPGRFGAPALGAIGGACATLGARTALLVGLAAYIALMPEARSLGVFARPRPDRPAEAEQRRIGFGGGASNLFEVSAFSSMTFIAGAVGALPLAAYTVALNILSLIFMVPLGLSTAIGIRVGTFYGARDRVGVNRAALVGLGVATGFAVSAALVVGVFAPTIASGYTRVGDVIEMASRALRLACLFVIPDALQVVAAQSLRSRGDVLVPSLTHLVSYALVMAPLAWLLALPLHHGVQGMIMATLLASLLSAALLLGRFGQLAGRSVG